MKLRAITYGKGRLHTMKKLTEKETSVKVVIKKLRACTILYNRCWKLDTHSTFLDWLLIQMLNDDIYVVLRAFSLSIAT
jgi:hypothetical protein